MRTATPLQPQKKTTAGSGRATSILSTRRAIDDAPGSPRTRSQAALSTRGSGATPRPSSKASRSRDRRRARPDVRPLWSGRSAAPDSASRQLLFEHRWRLLFLLDRLSGARITLLSGLLSDDNHYFCDAGANFASLTSACPSGLSTNSRNSTTSAFGLPQVHI